MLSLLRKLTLHLSCVAIALAPAMAFAVDRVAPNVGETMYKGIRCLNHPWFGDYNAALQEGLSEYYLPTSNTCSHELANDYGWGTPENPSYGACGGASGYPNFFHNSGIETLNTRRLLFTFYFPIGTCKSTFNDSVFVYRARNVDCPAGYGWSSEEKICVQGAPVLPDKNNGDCDKNGSNPIHTALGTKLQHEVDFALADSELSFERYYTSATHWSHGRLGKQWRHNFERSVAYSVVGLKATAYVGRPNGNVYYFERQLDGSFKPDADVHERLSLQLDGGGQIAGWTLAADDDSTEHYDAQGRLIETGWPNGRRLVLSYADGLLESVTDERGRAIRFEYESGTLSGYAYPYLSRVIEPTGFTHSFSYQAATSGPVIASRSGDDGKTRTYVYGEGGANSRLLTGIDDENGNRAASWRYDAQGRGILSVHGDASSYVDRVELSYSGDAATNPTAATTTVKQWVDGNANVFDQRTYGFALDHGVIRMASTTGPCTSCGGKVQQTTYDGNGSPDKRTDFNGVVTDTDFAAVDAAGLPRGLETRRVEAFARGTQTDLAERRTTETTWHADFRQPLERKLLNHDGVAEAVERWSYNARGQVTAHCRIDPADASALAYACSATTAPSGTAKVRRTVYSYCEAADVANPAANCPVPGYLKSVNGPRATTDAGMGGLDDVTTFSYRSADDAGCASGSCAYRKGDLWKVANALGQVTEYQRYDDAGQVTRMSDANGTITDTAYDDRGRLSSRRIYAKATPVTDAADAVTLYAYDGVGNLTRVTEPGGVRLDYVHDAANRLVEIADALGNRIVYTLDAAGNRVVERVYDASYDPQSPSTGLKRAAFRHYNALSRMTQVLNAAQQPVLDSTAFNGGGISDGYDANGNTVQRADGRGIVQRRQYDALNRITQIADDQAGSDPATADTLRGYVYDARNLLRSVTDPDGLTTTYTYDGLGNRTALDSPDTGHTAYAYDRAGNRSSQTDNRGITANYTHDALNRVVSVAYPGGDNTSLAYDQSNAVTGCTGSYPAGRLTRITDPSGTTTYCYDRRGNVLRKTQAGASATLTLSYTYLTNDRVASMAYPDGAVVSYQYDAAGRVTGLTRKATPASSTVTVVNTMDYLPFGPPQSVNFGNGRSLAKHYDADYLIDKVVSSASDGLKLDLTNDIGGAVAAASDTIGAASPTRRYVYDRLQRLVRVENGAGATQESFAYNRTGDRTSRQITGQPAQGYAYLAGTHRLGSVAGLSRSYDANGNMTGRGDGYVWSYNAQNRLDGVVLPDGGGGSVDSVFIDKAGTGTNGITPNGVFYRYNAIGQRVGKDDSGFVAPTGYLYDEAGRLVYVDGLGSYDTSYLYLGGTVVAQNAATGLSYLETDHLGTPRVAVNPTDNAVQWRWSFFGSAFGEHAAVNVGSSGVDVALRYPGQYFDAETGAHYNYFRDYEPATGRYVESDPVGLGGGVSTYGYVGGNPLAFVDPSGLVKWGGTYLAIDGAFGIYSGGMVIFQLRSECRNGREAVLQFTGMGAGGGVGAPFGFAGAEVTFEDGLDHVYPWVFEGAFSAVMVGASFPVGYGCATFHAGQAVSRTSCGPEMGYDGGVTGLVGFSKLDWYALSRCSRCKKN